MMVKLGNWLFHFRNFLFPLFYIALFIPSPPVFENTCTASVTGLILIFAGITVRCITIGLVYIVRGGNNREIYAEGLVTGGIYTICRNPMYLGNLLLLSGFGFFADSLIFILIFFPLFVFFYIAIIKAEEAFLINKFGKDFEDYRKNTNSIFPDLRNIGQAFKGHTFKWKKVLSKEHNSLFVYACGILLILLYNDQINLKTMIVILITISLVYGIIKYLKINHYLDE
jgi:protein-S-isoprenylcysteine O-methyltransferase Ste14